MDERLRTAELLVPWEKGCKAVALVAECMGVMHRGILEASCLFVTSLTVGKFKKGAILACF
jgi:hypothetical protein